jgi:cyclophilin family peptidyl-prolyl cis-trans isomerase
MVKFHRVIPGFMAQGGDPTGTGRGGPGYNYAGEFNEGAPKHDKLGTLSMANAGANTDGSQFFLTFRDTPHLNGRHTVFGRISDGVDVLKKLEKLGSPGRGAPREEIHIKTATIVVE